MGESSAEDEMNISIGLDEALQRVGEFGRYQMLLDGIFCLMTIPIGFQMVIMYFIELNPPWECVRNNSTTWGCQLNGTFAHDDNRRCKMRREEWKYTQPKDYSLVTQFDINCDKEWILHVTSSSLYVGWAVGSYVLGWAGDKYGRKIILFPTMAVILFVGFVTPFAPNVYFVILARFTIGFFCPATMFVTFIIISEFVGNKYRPLAGNLIWISMPVAFCILVLKAYFIRQWKTLSMVCTGPYIFVLAFYRFVPESIRWLEVQGRVDEVLIIIRKMGQWNKKTIPNNIVISHSPERTVHKANPLMLFTSRDSALPTLSLGIMWYVICLANFGLYMAADDLGGSVYTDFFILAVSDIPASFLAVYLCDCLGRKKTTVFALLMASIACISIFFVPVNRGSILRTVRLVLGLIGKFSVALANCSIATWSVEIFPIIHRVGGMGLMQISSRIGFASAPWIAKGLHVLNKGVPFVVMGACAFVGFITGLWLPETRTAKTKRTKKVETMDDIGVCNEGTTDMGMCIEGTTDIGVSNEGTDDIRVSNEGTDGIGVSNEGTSDIRTQEECV